jgi:exodeoxyribonuclease-1
MTRALRPDGINWPDYEDGKPCFKLEALTAANGLAHEAAHDALSDVYATIALARLIKQRQPRLYDYAWRLRDKRFAGSLIDFASGKPVLHISSRFAVENGNAALVLPLAAHPTNKNSVIAYNLSIDPEALLELPVEQLRQRLFTRNEDLPEGVARLALKEIHLNKTPMLVPLGMFDDATAERLGIVRAECERHWQTFHRMSLQEQHELQRKLHELYREQPFGPRSDPEQMLYEGFFGDDDRKLIQQVRRLSPEELAVADLPFRDARLPELLFRYRARNFPDSLNAAELERWRAFCLQRLTDPSAGASLVLGPLREQLARWRSTDDLTPEKRVLLSELESYAEGLYQTLSVGR